MRVTENIMSSAVFQTNPETVDLSQLPSRGAVCLSAVVDAVCSLCRCSNWREAIGAEPDSSVFPELESLAPLRPPMLTYKDFAAQSDGATGSAWSVQSLYQYAFHTNSTALSDLSTPSAWLVLVALVLVIRLVKQLLLPYFSSIGRKVSRRAHGAEWERANQIRIDKFGEYCFRILYHSFISIYGLYVFSGEDWMERGDGWLNFTGTLHLYKGWPMHPNPPVLTWYYLLQFAYNVDAVISLLQLSFDVYFQLPFVFNKKISSLTLYRSPIAVKWSKSVRGDFQEMAVHHVATNVLVFLSSYFRFTRIGCAVFMVHDVSDIPVDMSKLANFVKWKATTVVCFFLMCLMWLATRLYLLPFVILGSVFSQTKVILETTTMSPANYVVLQTCFSSLLGMLVLLHLAWFLMFIKMLIVLVVKKECHDLSEHKNGEHQQHVVVRANLELKRN